MQATHVSSQRTERDIGVQPSLFAYLAPSILPPSGLGASWCLSFAKSLTRHKRLLVTKLGHLVGDICFVLGI